MEKVSESWGKKNKPKPQIKIGQRLERLPIQIPAIEEKKPIKKNIAINILKSISIIFNNNYVSGIIIGTISALLSALIIYI